MRYKSGIVLHVMQIVQQHCSFCFTGEFLKKKKSIISSFQPRLYTGQQSAVNDHAEQISKWLQSPTKQNSNHLITGVYDFHRVTPSEEADFSPSQPKAGR